MRQKLLVLLGLALVTFGAHWRVLQNDFVNYDDNDYVTDNRIVQQGLTKEGVAWAFGNLHGTKTYWHPLTWLSHMLDCQLFKLNPAGHHAMSLLLHTLNVLLLFLVLQRMTGACWRSAVVAAIWAEHPLQVDTVAWVTERKNILGALFWLLTIAAYLRYAAKPGRGRYVVVLLGMVLGLMCKPVLVTLPCALLLLDFWPLRRWRPRATQNTAEESPPFAVAPLGRLLLEKLPLLALAMASAILTQLAHDRLGMREEIYGLHLHHKIANAAVSYVRYLDHTLWPLNLTVLYLHPGEWPDWRVAMSGAVLTIISALALLGVRRRPYLLVGWCWFLGVLVPTIGLRQVGIQAMADRFLYLPFIGLLVMIVWGVADRLPATTRWARISGVAVAVLIAALTTVTWRQTGFWKDSLALWQRAIAMNPKNYIAHANSSVELMIRGDLNGARRSALEAIRLQPTFTEPRLGLAAIASREGKLDEARSHADAAIRSRPGALPIVRQAADRWTAEGALTLALVTYDACMKVVPDDANIRAQRATVLDALNRPREAVEQYREALRLQPDWPSAMNNLAWLLATCADPALRDGAEAVRLAERACELTGRREAFLIGTLGAAYAEAGRFVDAIRAAEQAIAIAEAAGETPVAQRNRQLLELYRTGKPFRQQAPR